MFFMLRIRKFYLPCISPRVTCGSCCWQPQNRYFYFPVFYNGWQLVINNLNKSKVTYKISLFLSSTAMHILTTFATLNEVASFHFGKFSFQTFSKR